MDGRVHGVAKSQTRLGDFHFHLAAIRCCQRAGFPSLGYSHLLLQEAFLCGIVWASLQPGCLMGPFESVGAWSSAQAVQ